MDREEIASFVASTLSALGIAGTLVSHTLETLLPVLLIVLTVSLSFLFTRLNARDTRQYEIRKLEVQEALGPIYGQILKIHESFESNRAKLNVEHHPTLEDQWEGIRHSHRFFVIEEPLRSTIQAYFDRLNNFTKSEYLTIKDISEVEKVMLPNIVPGINEVMESTMLVAWSNGVRFTTTFQGALYWDVDPLSLNKGQFVELITSATMTGSGTAQRNVITTDPVLIHEVISNFWKAARPLLRENPRFVAEEKERYAVMEETTRLRLTLEEGFSKWAGR